VRISEAEAKALGRRREQPVKAPGEILAIFVSGKLTNPLNGPQGRGATLGQLRYRVEWKQRVAQVLLENRLGGPPRAHDPLPLRVTFVGHTHNSMDSDGLQAACKPIRDALVECGVLASDAPGTGHVFAYEQRIDRAHRGVEIRVAPREGA
jgi:hypothetical protein